MNDRRRRRRAGLAAALLAATVLTAAGAAVAQTGGFSDVPASHPDRTAIEWAAGVGLTLGYGDGTFRPGEPLNRNHALVFVERLYDDVLEADRSERFTRGDMMRLLYEIAGPTTTTTTPTTTTAPDGRDYWLLTLTAAFMGTDIYHPRPVANNYCTANQFDGLEALPEGRYSESWYAWEWCLFGGQAGRSAFDWHALGPSFSGDGSPEAKRRYIDSVQQLVDTLWAAYLPWTEEALADALGLHLNSVRGKLKPPTLHVGQAAIERYCPGSESVAGCFDWGDLDGLGDRLTSYTPGRIVVDDDLNLLDVLHELAHAIDAHQWLRWPDDPDPDPGTAAFEHERTDGHGLSFRCLALDLYPVEGVEGLQGTAYRPLKDLCRLHAPGYAQRADPTG